MPAKDHYERILIPYDFSDTAKLALEHAQTLVQQLKVDVVLLHIVETPSIVSSFKNVFRSEEKKFHEHAEEELKKVAESFSHKIGSKVIYNAGGVPGFVSKFIRCPETQLTIIILSNLENMWFWNQNINFMFNCL